MFSTLGRHICLVDTKFPTRWRRWPCDLNLCPNKTHRRAETDRTPPPVHYDFKHMRVAELKLTSHFEAREWRQILAVRPPYFVRCSTLTLVGSELASLEAWRQIFCTMYPMKSLGMVLSWIGYRQGTMNQSTISLDWRRSLVKPWLNVVADIATRITGEEISASNKHLDQNELVLIQIRRLAQSVRASRCCARYRRLMQKRGAAF